MSFINNMKNVSLKYAIDCMLIDTKTKVVDTGDVIDLCVHSSTYRKVKKTEIKNSASDLKDKVKEKFNKEKDTEDSAENVAETAEQVEAEVVEKENTKIVDPILYTNVSKAVVDECMVDDIWDEFDDDKLVDNIESAIAALPSVDPKLVRLTILSTLYIGMVITPEQVFKNINQKENMNELEIINSIIHFYSGLSFYTGASVLMINDVFDNLKDLSAIMGYEASYSGIEDNDALTEVFNKTRDLMTGFDRKIKDANHDDSEATVPLFFINGNLDLSKSKGVSKQLQHQIVTSFGNLLDGYQYQFNKINDLIELVISRGDATLDSYLIDPGYIIGNGYNIIHQIGSNYAFINLKYKDVVAKVLQNRNYIPTPQEMQMVSVDLFTNGYIYHMMDMSKAPEFLPKLSKEDMSKLGKKLTFIMNLPVWSVDGHDRKTLKTRLRFRSFKSVDDFTVVSDDKCKCPLSNMSWQILSPGVVIKVKGDKVEFTFGNINEKFDITKYNVM